MATLAARIARPILSVAALTLLYTTAGAGWHEMAKDASKLVRLPKQRRKAPAFSHPPIKRTPKPGIQRIPWMRGGVWTREAIEADKRVRFQLAMRQAEEDPERRYGY